MRVADAANSAFCGGAKDGAASVHGRPEAGGLAVHSTPEEQSARTDQDMGAPEMLLNIPLYCCSISGGHTDCSLHSGCVPQLPASSCNFAGSPGGHSQYMESRPSAAALSPEQRASPARLQAMAAIAGRTLQGTAHRRLHLVPGALTWLPGVTAAAAADQLAYTMLVGSCLQY